MKELIQSFLSRHYEIKTSDVGNDGIYDKHDTRRHKAPVYGERLTQDLITIFGLKKRLTVKIINEWAKSVKPNVKLKFYWKTVEAFFPKIERVNARTVGMEIVSVQPMAAPTGKLFFLDYSYSGNTPSISPERQGIIDELICNQQRHLDEGPEEIARQSWNGRLETPYY